MLTCILNFLAAYYAPEYEYVPVEEVGGKWLFLHLVDLKFYDHN